MSPKCDLTVKTVEDDGDTHYNQASYIGLIWPKDGRPNFAVMDCGDENHERREIIKPSTLYIMNSAGKTIDIFSVGRNVAPISQAA